MNINDSPIASRSLPARNVTVVFFLSILIIFPVRLFAIDIEKIQELYVRNFYNHSPENFIGMFVWSTTKSGYVLKTASCLYFYSDAMELLRKVDVDQIDQFGAIDLFVEDDTSFYILESNSIKLYNSSGIMLRKLRYSASSLSAQNLAVNGNRISLGGQKYWFASDNNTPTVILYDLDSSTPSITTINPYPDEALLSLDSNLNILLSPSVTSFKDGFVVAGNATQQIVAFSFSGRKKWEINDTPPGYRGLKDAPALDPKKAYEDEVYTRKWESSWDYATGWTGIRVLSDSLLIVPRRIYKPFYVDLYNLNQRRFLKRLQSDSRLVGASNGCLFFVDSVSDAFMKISVYRIVESVNSGTAKSNASCENQDCPTCGKAVGKYPYVETPQGKSWLNDTINAGNNRPVLVLGYESFEPDSLLRFCDKNKKNMFVFVSPDELGGDGVLLDTLSRCIKGRDDWKLTVIVCCSKPEELVLYILNLPGQQVLVNRNEAIPDSTMNLSDIQLPPMALAFDTGGTKFIAGYSLAPYYDEQKIRSGKGITFENFMRKCGIIE